MDHRLLRALIVRCTVSDHPGYLIRILTEVELLLEKQNVLLCPIRSMNLLRLLLAHEVNHIDLVEEVLNYSLIGAVVQCLPAVIIRLLPQPGLDHHIDDRCPQ